MFKKLISFFLSKKGGGSKDDSSVHMADMLGNPLSVGDRVEALRYDLGSSIIIETDKGLAYQSEATGKTVQWVYMIDATTGNQKVKKYTGEVLED